MASQSAPKNVPWIAHAASQLKFVLPGALATYYLNVLEEYWNTLSGPSSLGRTIAFAAGGLGLTTVSLFIYLLFAPILTGEEIDFRTWRQSATLSSVIPILTASIVLGWMVAVAALGLWSNLGVMWSVVGVTGVYALTFGLLGLIPAPKPSSRRRD